jgi:hypothetical protein
MCAITAGEAAIPTPVMRAGSFGITKKMTYVIRVATKKSQIAQKTRLIRKRISSVLSDPRHT